LIDENNDCLMLNIVKNNHAAKSLYLNFGFKVFEEFEGKMYEHKIPGVRMKRNKSAEQALAQRTGRNWLFFIMLMLIKNYHF
jgi:hypothetical protein